MADSQRRATSLCSVQHAKLSFCYGDIAYRLESSGRTLVGLFIIVPVSVIVMCPVVLRRCFSAILLSSVLGKE